MNAECRLPELVSCLFDHRFSFPHSDVQLFHHVVDASLDLDADFQLPDDTESRQKLLDWLHEAQFPIEVRIREINKGTAWLLSNAHGAKGVDSLEIEFYYNVPRDKVSELIGDKEVDLNLAFPNLRFLAIKLDKRIDQRKQLKSLLNLNHVERIEIDGIAQSGAEFLLQHRQNLPEEVYADLDDMKIPTKLWKTFYSQFKSFSDLYRLRARSE